MHLNQLLSLVNETSSEYSWESPGGEKRPAVRDLALMRTWSVFMPLGGDSETWSEAITRSLTYVRDSVYVSMCTCVYVHVLDCVSV